MSEAALTLDGLACRRGDRLLWRGVSARLAASGALHVTGANGIGKSSLIRIIAGLLPAEAGRVSVIGAAGLVDEAHALDRDQPLARALDFWARIDSAGSTGVGAAIERLGIAHLADVPVRILSTGQRKRAALARLLVSNARLWLLDEPANGLDRAGVGLLEALIADHRQSGGALVLASHQALGVADAALLDLAEYQPCA